jgi:hypothetical protein
VPLVTPHFSLNELTVTSKVDDAGKPLPNNPGPLETLYLRVLAETLLEPIRVLCGGPLLITSGYRSPEVEQKVSGKQYGQHMKGQAADLIPQTLDLDEAYRRIYASGLPFDQLLLEAIGGKRWIHVSCAPVFAQPRREALTTTDGVVWARYAPPSTTGEGTT